MQWQHVAPQRVATSHQRTSPQPKLLHLLNRKIKFKHYVLLNSNIKGGKTAFLHCRCRFRVLRLLTCSDSHVIDVVVRHDFASILLGVVDTSIQYVLDSTDVSEGVTRTGVRHFSITLQLFPFQIFRLYKTKGVKKYYFFIG